MNTNDKHATLTALAEQLFDETVQAYRAEPRCFQACLDSAAECLHRVRILDTTLEPGVAERELQLLILSAHILSETLLEKGHPAFTFAKALGS